MKKVLYLALMAVINLPLRATTHANTWHTVAFEGMTLEMTGQYELWTYRIAGDTVLDGKTYTAFIGQETRYGVSNMTHLIRYSEDSMQVYLRIDSTMRMDSLEQIRPYMDGNDILVYDYAAEVGETVYSFVYDCQGGHLFANLVDSVATIDGRRVVYVSQRNIFTKDGMENEGSYIWTEGLGGMHLLPRQACEGGSRDWILCAQRDGELLYRMDDADYLRFWNQYGVPSPCHEVTAIEETFSPQKDNTIPYNLLGQPVDETYHGIVIQGGKKMLQ